MRHNFIHLCMLATAATALTLSSCTEDAYVDAGRNYSAPSNLQYVDLVNARDHSYIMTGRPTVDTQNLIPTFEIVSITDDSGQELSADDKGYVSIMNPKEKKVDFDEDRWYVDEQTGDTIKSDVAYDTVDAGKIVIADGNKFDVGVYHFDVKVTTTSPDGVEYTTIFDDAFNLTIQPRLVHNLMYWPMAQNLVPSEADMQSTSEALPLNGNLTDVSYQLGSHKDILTIDPSTGALSIADGYTVTERVEITPVIQVVNNMTEEVVEFSGAELLTVVLSTAPVTDLPTVDYLNFFYPTMEGKNSMYGFTYKMIEQGIVKSWEIWKSVSPTNYSGAVASRPTDIAKKIRGIGLNLTVGGGENTPVDSWVFMNAQDLTLYKNYNQKAIFYLMNKYLEYMPDGTSPTAVDVMVSTDYTGNVGEATWVNMNDKLFCELGDKNQTGMPYFGDLKNRPGESAEVSALKASNAFNNDGKWFKATLDLNEFKEETRVTVAFHVYNTYTGTLVKPSTSVGRPGNFMISDVHYVVDFN